MSFLSSIIDDGWSHPPLFVVQSSTAQSSLPLFRQVIGHGISETEIKNQLLLLFCLLYPSSSLLPDIPLNTPNIEVYEWTHLVPGYQSCPENIQANILAIVKAVPSASSIHVVLDSIDTLLSDTGSTSVIYNFLFDVFSLLRSRFSHFRLTLHAVQSSPLVPLLIQSSFSPSLVYLVVHPPVVLSHLAKEYLIPPPPLSVPAKFWGTFIPFSERIKDVNQLVFGRNADGTSFATEIVVEILVRKAIDTRVNRGVDRLLEGWKAESGACCLLDLECLKGINTNLYRQVDAVCDPARSAQHALFNLDLTASQQESRSRVPLPYMHRGNQVAQKTIHYDPDSADDLDEDDPDEDLNI